MRWPTNWKAGNGRSPNGHLLERSAIKRPRPIACFGHEAGSHWIFANVLSFRDQSFVSSQTMIKEVSLPRNAGKLGCCSLKIANYLGEPWVNSN
jgi:hypothetical protein